MLAALRDRYGLELRTEGWESKAVQGGAAIGDEVVARLAAGAMQFDDERAVVYEMESTKKEFEPLEIPLSHQGFEKLRHSMIAHFDLLLVPRSRQWAMVMSHELEGMVLGRKDFVASI
jgi:hypothetical protein